MKKLIFPLVLLIIAIGIPVITIQESKLPQNIIETNNEIKVAIMENSIHQEDVSDVVYNSNPPTSGPHFSDWHREWKFYDQEQPVGGLVHNLEHGGIVMYYDPSIDDTFKSSLSDYVDKTFKIIASPRKDLNAPIVLASWGVYEEFNTFDEDKFERFYKSNLNNAPENVYP